MMISPPILLPHDTNEDDDKWVDRCMVGDAPGRGAYPLSHEGEWHGGLHLTAPRNGTNVADIRAVADGIVIFLRIPSEVSASQEDHPLNYHHGYTSDGCVVVEHLSEIGEGADAAVRFYSVYHHLINISDRVAPGKKIYRKDCIGNAGCIYGEKDRFHFEICCDDVNLKKLTGRATGNLSISSNGRRDSVFGEVYFTIPAGTPLYAEKPVDYRVDGARQLPKPSHNAPWPPLSIQTATFIMPGDIIIGLRYGENGRTAAGAATLTTYRPDGSAMAPPMIESDAEYSLYETANRIHKAWQDARAQNAGQYPNIPSASAIYEMLRFGRVINTVGETLTPADAAHWRKIRCEDREGWINLNAVTVRVFSDADFPGWKHWKLIDDDSAATDSKCDSVEIGKILNINSESGAARNAEEMLVDPIVQRQLRRVICKFPCEWDEATIDLRWSWLKAESPNNPKPMTEAEYAAAMNHLKLLCIPCPMLFSAQWRFEPREFIKLFRRCGWLSDEEFAQCFPRNILHLKNTKFYSSAFSWEKAIARAKQWKKYFNISTRKFGIANSKYRMIHFFSHVIPETGNLSLVREIGGEDCPYSPYFGRGLIQLTHLENYKTYGDFKDFAKRYPSNAFPGLGWSPDALIAANNEGNHDPDNCADSACFYIVQRKNMLRHLDRGVDQDDSLNASKDVNGNVALENLNGLDIRLQSVEYLKSLLLDEVVDSRSISMTFAWRRNSAKEPAFDANGSPIMFGNPPRQKLKFYLTQHTIAVSLEQQKP